MHRFTSLIASLSIIGGVFGTARAATLPIDELHPIFSEPDEIPRAPATAWTTEISEQLPVLAPTNREPASVKKQRAGKSAGRSVKKGGTGLRARFPVSVTDGFEVRSQFPLGTGAAKGRKKAYLVTTFLVLQRGDKHDLLYKNSEGSQASVSLDSVTYSKLRAMASAIPSANAHLEKCQGTMQLLQMTTGKDRSTLFCLNQTSKAAEQVRALGNTLVVFVR